MPAGYEDKSLEELRWELIRKPLNPTATTFPSCMYNDVLMKRLQNLPWRNSAMPVCRDKSNSILPAGL